MIKKDNLVACWKLNGAKDSDGKVLDFSGHGNSGTINGTEAYVENQNGKQAQEFDGNNNSISILGTSLYSNAEKTICAWINIKDFSASNIVHSFTTGSAVSGTFEVQTTGKIRVELPGTGGRRFYSTNTLSLNTDYFICYTTPALNVLDYASVDDAEIYLNGEKEAVSTSSIGNNTNVFNNHVLGVYSLGNPLNDFNGSISDVRIYDVALTETEVKQLYVESQNPQEFSPSITPSLTSDGVDDYIDTGLASNTISKVILDAKMNNDITTATLFGAGKTSDSNGFIIGDSASKWLFGIGAVNSVTTYDLDADNLRHVHTAEVINSTTASYTVDGVGGSFTYTDSPTSDNFWLYGRSAASSLLPGDWDLYSCKIYDLSGVLVRDFKPLADGTFIDVVNNVIYPNDGTGDLVYKQDALNTTDDTLVFSTRDGIKDLTGKNDITNTDTIVGKGMVFDGTDSKLVISNTALKNIDFTLKTVINPFSSGESGYGRLFDIIRMISYIDPSGKIGISNTGGLYVLSLGEPPYNQNTHIVITKTALGIVNIYINGELDVSGNIGTTTGTVSDLVIGNSLDQVATFDGKMDIVEIFNEIKTATWAKQDYEKEMRFF